jgi:hypothetical protein
MICTEPLGCTERPAPQAVGDPFWVYTDTIGADDLLAKQIIVGNKYTWADTAYLNGYRVNVVLDSEYVVYARWNDGVLEQLFSFTATQTGWIEFPVAQELIRDGTTLGLFLTINEPAPVPITWNGNWYYDTPPNATVPAVGVVMHANSTPNQMWFNKTDDDAGDRGTELEALTIGDVIDANGRSWSIQAISDLTDTILFTVAPTIQTAPDAIYNFLFETVTAATIDYAVDTNYWSTSPYPLTKGFFSSTGIDNVVEDDNAYGVDLLIQNATASDQWEPLSVSSGLGGGSGGETVPGPWTDVTFEGTWVNYGAGDQEVQYRLVGDMVQVRGTMKDGSTGPTAFTLPPGFRPPAEVRQPISGYSSGVQNGQAVCSTNGDIAPFITSGARVSMDLTFSITEIGIATQGQQVLQILSVPSTHQFPYKLKVAPDATPTLGKVSADNADSTLITIIYLHRQDDDWVDISLFVQELEAGDELNAHETADASNNRFYNVTAAPTLVGDVWHIPVVFASGAGTPLGNNDAVQIYLKHV